MLDVHDAVFFKPGASFVHLPWRIFSMSARRFFFLSLSLPPVPSGIMPTDYIVAFLKRFGGGFSFLSVSPLKMASSQPIRCFHDLPTNPYPSMLIAFRLESFELMREILDPPASF